MDHTNATSDGDPTERSVVDRILAATSADDLHRYLGKCVASLSDSILITEAEPFDRPGPRIVFVNEAFERQTGYLLSEIVGQSPRILQGPLTDKQELRRMGAALRNWEIVRTELTNYKKDGRTFIVEMDIVPIADERGWFTHWVSVQRDVTERKRTEAEAAAREAQRVESLGTLTSGIAHDFNNIVASILGNVAVAKLEATQGQSTLDSLNQINSAAVRARTLIQQILSYSRRQPKAFESQQIAPVVEEALQLLKSTLPAGVSVNVRLPGLPLWVMADSAQLVQVLLNLGTNAWHSLPNRRGTIDVSVSVVSEEPSTPADVASTAIAPRRSVSIRVRDYGSGMDSATQGRMFEPYFTTKAIGEGTGLGLSVVWGIVAEHGGKILVESEIGRGSTVTVLLPLAPAVVAAPPKATAIGDLPLAHSEHVICIDDDSEMLVAMTRLLTNSGYRVSAFKDPSLAVEAVRLSHVQYDVVICDFNMPGLSGLDVASGIASIRPDLPVVLATGYLSDELLRTAGQAGVARVFGKEYLVEQLNGIIREVLGGSRPKNLLQD